MIRRVLGGVAISALLVSLSGCGLFWGSSDENEPTPLTDIDAEKHFTKLWSAELDEGPGELFNQFAPAVDQDHVYVAGRDGEVLALDRETGEQVWQRELETPLVGGVGVGGDTLIVTSLNGDVIALNAQSGQDLWKGRVASEVTAPAQFNRDIAVVQVINGRVVAFDRATGKRMWSYDSQIPELSLRGTAMPLVVANATLAGFANGKMVAISNESGTAIWEQYVALPEGRTEFEQVTDVDGQPMLYQNMLYASSYQGRLVAIDPRSAREVWHENLSSYRGLTAGFSNVYAIADNDDVKAFDASTGTNVWTQDKLRFRQLTSPVAIGNDIMVGDREGYLHVMSQVDGHFVARYEVDSEGIEGTPFVVDDKVYVLSDSGRVVALQLD